MNRNNEDIEKALDKASYTLDKAFLDKLLEDYKIIEDSDNNRIVAENIRLLQVKRWVKASDESVIDCFRNVLGTFSADGKNNIAMILNRTPDYSEMYFAISNLGDYNSKYSKDSVELLKSTLLGNFNGSELSRVDEIEGLSDASIIEKKINQLINNGLNYASVITGVPSEKSQEFNTQGIEKVLDGIVPKSEDESYTIVFIAEPMNSDKVRTILNGYEEMISSLTPFESNQVQISENTSESKGESSSLSITNTIGQAITKTHSVHLHAGVTIGGDKAGVNMGVGYGYARSKTKSDAKSDTDTKGTNYMLTDGKGKAETYSIRSYVVRDLIEKGEKMIKRIQLGQADGLWECATYVLSPDRNIERSVAGYIASVFCGDESYIEKTTITEWSPFDEGRDYDLIIKNISQFTNPIFVNKADKTPVKAVSYVNTTELSAMFAFPRHSVPGLPIMESASFGREPYLLSQTESKLDLDIGCAYHMLTEEANRRISLSRNELTKHTFITGSTGSGKSNMIYNLLSKICFDDSKQVKFLVIEPAKGEYKHIFGKKQGVSVYGTNAKITPLLRLNPFSFPSNIHVLEHLDRLIEIFNVCWPMYAAMPAVLKSAVEKSYSDCGWDLITSTNPYGEDMYPTFADVTRNIRSIIDNSEYDAENKGAYKGSLVTRLQSLSNGINGMIFTVDEILPEDLFDENVIIDLSRVGSSETKSLLMGILVLKLQEYRMSCGGMNEDLKHITVLEEAHNLLKRTSAEQPVEGGNLAGKSVEMISNAIAEMRTYGEGFIIADQAPALLDMAAIRNTNTKIIMRLPDESDRELVGKAANLNESQIKELAKLPCGVAAIYQNEWIQPVLCKTDEYKSDESTYAYEALAEKSTHSIDSKVSMHISELLFNGTKLGSETELKDIMSALKNAGVSSSMQVTVIKNLRNPTGQPKFTKIALIIGVLFPDVKSAVSECIADCSDEREWTISAEIALKNCLNTEISDNIRRDIIQAVVTDCLYSDMGKMSDLQRWAEKGGLV